MLRSIVVATVFALAVSIVNADGDFKAGSGIYDITGPVTEIGFMGYAALNQTGRGLHTRLFSRAFVFEDSEGSRAVYVSIDVCMSMLSMKLRVIEELRKIYGDLYTHNNVMISGIHTHSGPGAFSYFLLYDITTYGMDKKHLQAVVDGIVQSITLAHEDIKTSSGAPIKMAQGMLSNASRNRSPSSYLANPIEERQEYEQWGGDVDYNMTVLNIKKNDSTACGAISIYAVHCTSMHNTNRLVSSDNKGHASYLFEREMNGNLSIPGEGHFVAAFGQSNEGDVSPNTQGAWCNGIVGGIYCGNNRSLCNNRTETCLSVGPTNFKDDVGSTRIIGERQYMKAKELYEEADKSGKELGGKIQVIHRWVDMSSVNVSSKFSSTGKNETTCRPAVGFSFAAGTTDGPGDFDFYQGDNCTDCMPFWNYIKNWIKKPTKEQIACHHPKPILLDVGEIKPHPWVPTTLPLQMFKLGELVIVAVPSEFTTMSGRRLRRTVEAEFASQGQPVTVVIAGLANAYSQYTATFEEYQFQRYEAASTLYGPHQLAAYQQNYAEMAHALATGGTVDPGTPPANESFVNFNLRPPVIYDGHPSGKPFGSVKSDVSKNSFKVNETVSVQFWGANLRNDYMNGGSYMEVQKLNDNKQWQTIMTDANWETKVHWHRQSVSESVVTCEWTIPSFAPAGSYRISHSGAAKTNPVSGTLHHYQGQSSTFEVLN